MRLMYISLADISVNNGQGIYSRKVLETLIEKWSETSSEEISVVMPKPAYPQRIEAILGKSSSHFLPSKRDRSVWWHFVAQIAIFFVMIKHRPGAVIYSVKPSLIAVPIACSLTSTKKLLLVEGLGIATLGTLGGGIVRKLGSISFKRQFDGAAAIFVAYRSAKSWVETYAPDCPVEIAPCGIDERIFTPVETSNLGPSESMTIGYVGSFRRVHGVELLVASAARYPACTVVLIGTGAELENIKRLVARLGISNRVRFVGEVEQRGIPEWLERCHLMWGYMDPKYWGVPIKVSEYLGCNKLVVATKGAEDLDFIEDRGFGYLIEDNGVDAIVELFARAHDRLKKPNFEVQAADYIKEHNNWKHFQRILAHVD